MCNNFLKQQNMAVYPISSYILRYIREKGAQFVAQSMLKKVSSTVFVHACMMGVDFTSRKHYIHTRCGSFLFIKDHIGL